MTDRDLLLELSKDIREIKHGMQSMSDDMHMLTDDVQGLRDLKDEVQVLKEDVRELQRNVQDSNQRLIDFSLTLENVTNRDIQILAGSHIDLIDKMNAAIQAQEKSILYEVQS